MNDLIEGFTIFQRYGATGIGAEHDVIYIYGITASAVSNEDRATLKELGFSIDGSTDSYYCYV